MTNAAIIEAAFEALQEATGYGMSDDNAREFSRIILVAVTPLIRNAVLEEAAKVADFRGGLSPDPERIIAKQVAAAIRALKEQP
jgi:hypothetical protein